jgi:hypothetical protein
VPLEVVQRIGLGPRQGIALVRIGERVVAVSVGEGGVRPLMEVDEPTRDALLAPAVQRAALNPAGAPALPPDFATAFRTALKNTFRSAAVLAALAGGLAVGAPAPLAAQALPPPAAQAPPRGRCRQSRRGRRSGAPRAPGSSTRRCRGSRRRWTCASAAVPKRAGCACRVPSASSS